MRSFWVLIVLIIALWAIDTFANGGQYGRAVWYEANHQGKMFCDEMADWLRSVGR